MLKKITNLFKILGKDIFYRELFRKGVYYVYEHVLPISNLKVGKNSEIHPTVSFRFEKNISIGDDVVLDTHCCLWASQKSKITIGLRVGVGPGTVIVSSNHSFAAGSSYVKQPLNEKDILVGDDVWIGANCSILGGASIGSGSIIGSGCVVYRSVPENSVVVSGSRKLSIIERR